jgi:hypothetical protein
VIIPPNREPGLVIQAIAGPGGPASRPGVPALPLNLVALVPALIGLALPAPVDPLAGI